MASAPPAKADTAQTAEHAQTDEQRTRHSHVPAAGTAGAAEVERARSEMLDDAKPRNRTRIGADVVCEALLRQGVDVMFGYPGGVILPLYDILDDYPSSGTSWSATSRAPRTRPMATPARSGKRRRLPRHLGPRRHQPGHRRRARRSSTPSPWSPSPATCPAR